MRHKIAQVTTAVVLIDALVSILHGLAHAKIPVPLSSLQQLFVNSALKYLITLLEKYLPSPPLAVVDNLDPLRRFEMAFPSLGQELNDILQKDTSLAAREMLQLAQRELESHLQNYPALAVEVVLNQLNSNNHSVG